MIVLYLMLELPAVTVLDDHDFELVVLINIVAFYEVFTIAL
jgi:hypothetical protein